MLFPFSFMQSQVSVDPDAAAFFARVTAAGGTLSATEQSAVNTLVVQMKAAGTWTPMKAIYPMVGASAAACAQNLKSASSTGSFTSGWTFASTGVTPNGTSAYFNTGLSPTGNLAQTSQSFSVYIRDNPSSTGWDLNSEDTGATFFSLIIAAYAGGGPFVGNNTGLTSTTGTTAVGFTLNTRIINSTYKIFRNNTSILTAATPTDGQTTTNFILGARNTTSSFANKNYAFCHIGDGLTDTEAGNFYTAVQAFQTTLSRAIAP
jgi:hypothetical protein